MIDKSQNGIIEENIVNEKEASKIIEGFDKNKLSILSRDYVVTKSNNLLFAFEAPLSPSAFYLLDTYLSKINPKDPSSARVGFKKTDYFDLLGKELRTSQIEKILAELRHKDMYIKNENGDKIVLNLFSLTGINKDGTYIILECNPRLKHLFFDVDQFGYFRYQLKNTLNLSSAHHMTLYNYLMANSFKREWIIDIKELVKKHLHIKGDYYLTYYRLNEKILSPAIKEINEKTNLTIKYESSEKAGSTGNKVVSVKFTVLVKDNMVYTKGENLKREETKGNDYLDDPRESKYENEQVAYLAGACNYEFTNEEMQVLFDLFLPHNDKLPKEGMGLKNDRYNFLALKYHEMELVASKKNIKNRFSYLKKILLESLKELS